MRGRGLIFLVVNKVVSYFFPESYNLQAFG